MDFERPGGVKQSIDFFKLPESELRLALQEVTIAAVGRGLIQPLGLEAMVASDFPTLTATELVPPAVAAERTFEQPPRRAELTMADVKTGLSEQLPTTYRGYSTYLESINRHRVGSRDQVCRFGETEVSGFFDEALTQWGDAGVLDFVKGELEADPDLEYTLVAQPNVGLTLLEFEQLMEDFAKGHPHPARADIDDLVYSRVTPRQLSGESVPGLPAVHFFLIPNKSNLIYETVRSQQVMLEEAKTEQPQLVIPPPAVVLNFWHTLQAKDDLPISTDKADYRGKFDETVFRHLDILTKYKGANRMREDYALELFISSQGLPTMNFISAKQGRNARAVLEQRPAAQSSGRH